MWAGRRTGKGKGQRDRVGKTSIRTESFQARVTDLDPIRVSPYGPAACHLPHREAGHTTAPDRMHRADQKLLASTGASTHDLDPIRVSPYGPAACHLPHREAGHTTAPDRMHRADQKLLASTGASTHVPSGRGTEPAAVAFDSPRRRTPPQCGHCPPPFVRASVDCRNGYPLTGPTEPLQVKGGQEMPGALSKTIPRTFRSVFWKRFPGKRNAAKMLS